MLILMNIKDNFRQTT